MANIVFLIDIEEGHLFPTFGLANSLKERKHDITYFSLKDNEKFIKDQGFRFISIFEDLYPEGYVDLYKNSKKSGNIKPIKAKHHLAGIMDGSIDHLFHDHRPDMLIVSTFLSLEALVIYFMYNVKSIIFTPFLRPKSQSSVLNDCLESVMNLSGDITYQLIEKIRLMGYSFNSLKEFVLPLNSFTELIPCPRDFEIDNSVDKNNQNTFYIGPSIRRKSNLSLEGLNTSLPKHNVIYASLGSQALDYGTIFPLFIESVFDLMRRDEMRDFRLILSLSGSNLPEYLELSVPKNIFVNKWVSQIAVLEIASVAIIHGGLGTIKECIFYGVPMIVIPIDYDQPSNAEKVHYHNIGITLNKNELKSSLLADALMRLNNDKLIKQNLRRMQKKFHRSESNCKGANIIESLL